MKQHSDSFTELFNLLDKLSPDQESLHKNDPAPPAGDDLKNRDLDREDHAQDIRLKEKFAKHVLIITYGWLIFLVIFFATSGIINACQEKSFSSDAVLITLVSGTSLSVIIGMLSIILRHLFTGKKH